MLRKPPPVLRKNGRRLVAQCSCPSKRGEYYTIDS
nr:MAG TPA: hypothetical protein [Caudoviricetes sp.]DAZ64450.1 MAG TPA: hypothetical protein [Caudoviricetes sp.]